jgi:hypothetical protein
MRSIDLLQRSSTEYFKQSGCVGCHHQPVTAMAVRTARLANIPVNEDTSREQMNVMRSQAATGQEAYLQGMDQGNSNTPVNLLEGLAATGYAPDILTDSVVSSVAALQRLDGSWRRGQTAPRPPIEESDISRTALALRMLQVYSIPARSAEFENRVRRAREWLLKAKPRTTDERAMLLLGLSWAGAPKRTIKTTAKALVALQQGNGGWAGNPNLASDAFSTGETLYALRESASIQVGDLVYQRGTRFLLETQFEDGSWYVRSRAVKFQPYFQSGFPFEHDQWISAAGTAWASVALAATIEMQNGSANQ